MRDLFSSMDSSRVGFYKSVLEEEGIPCFIRNEMTSQVVNMLAMVLQPTLCVLNDDDYDEAIALLRPHHRPPVTASVEWICTSCQETNPGEFELCWNCQQLQPEEK